MMPTGGAEPRAAQLAELSLIRHELLASPRMADLLDEAEANGAALDDWQRANLAEMRHRWVHATALPSDLVAAMSEAEARCEMVWRDARPASDFESFAAAFEPLLALVREKASALSEALGCAPYDALIDTYDPGLRRAAIDPLFDDLRAFLPDFLDDVRRTQSAARNQARIGRSFPVAEQRALAERLMTALGFDFAHGRLDVSHHPFCGGVTGDIRITTRYDEQDVVSGLMGVLHETGHALYEAGLPDSWRLQPVGEARGMALHESQSLLVEMQACRSREFIGYLADLLREMFGADADLRADALAGDVLHVEPGFIRVEADEVTYPAHIMLRYGLETALLAGDLAVADIPEAWRDGMRSLLGIEPGTHAEGCLQDIHWATGELGYFPSYTLGALMAAQFFDAACRADGEILPAIGRGDFTRLFAWTRDNVHRLGSRHSMEEVVTAASGAPLGTTVFKAHLKRRYLG